MSDSAPPNLPATESIRRQSQGEAVARLVVTQGPSAGRTLVLNRARATVGRHETNDLTVADRRVSATHLELERRSAGRLLVRDLETTNGTWLGTHRLYEAELGPGALLQIGDSAIRIELDDRVAPAPATEGSRFGGLVGSSLEMRELFAMLERVAPTELSILAEGEAGTGKQELARAVHESSPRRGGPFVVLDATSLLASTAASALFGHEQGAVPGADALQVGALERAHGGTLFIDTVSDLPLDLQPQLLRALEARAFSRLGGTSAVPVDVRLVASSHRDLRAEIEAGRFREELYFRVAEARVAMPPLRARPRDIGPLSEHFLAHLKGAGRALSITAEAIASLEKRRWPGNVRELRNTIGRATALSADGVIREADVAGEGFGFRGSAAEREALDLGGTFAEAKARAVDRFERAYLEALMRRCSGNLSQGSREADIARHHLRALLKKRGLYDPGDT